jgi:hypothetical protein
MPGDDQTSLHAAVEQLGDFAAQALLGNRDLLARALELGNLHSQSLEQTGLLGGQLFRFCGRRTATL